jgi:hypothetical protein
MSPFDNFYDVVKRGILPGLESLEGFVDLGNSIKELREQAKLEYSMEFVRKMGQDKFIENKDKEGFLTFIDINSINMAHHLINKDSSCNKKIYYLVEIGEKIPQNAAIFSFESIDQETDKTVTELLSKAYEIKEVQPGWVNEFAYIDPLFKAVENEITDTVTLNSYINKLIDLAYYDITERHRIIGESENGIQEIKCFWVLDRWFDRYYELIKKSCVIKGDLARTGRLLEWRDEPDPFVIARLQRLMVILYKFDLPKYFRRAISHIYSYSQFLSQISNESHKEEIYLKKLNQIVENISWQAADREAPSSGFVVKLEGYVRYIVTEYLKVFKELIIDKEHIINDPTSYNVIFTKYKLLNKHFAEDIELRRTPKDFSPQDIKALERIKILLLSMLFVMMVYMLKKVHEGKISNDIYITFSRRFFGKYQSVYLNDEHWRSSLIQFGEILDCSYDLLNKDLGWFEHLMEKEDIYDESKPHPDTMVRDLEYCYYAFIFTLCLSKLKIKLDKSYWYPDKIKTLRHFYDLLMKLIKAESILNEILIAYCDDNLDKLKEILDKLKDLLGGNNA